MNTRITILMLCPTLFAACGHKQSVVKVVPEIRYYSAGEPHADSCIRFCSQSTCLSTIKPIVGGAQIELTVERDRDSIRWILLPDSILNNFRLDAYDVTGQRLTSVQQECQLSPPVKISLRRMFGKTPSGTYYVTISHNDSAVSTAKVIWRRNK